MKQFVVALGIIFLLLGLVTLIHPDFDYHRREEIARVGPVRTSFDRPEHMRVPPLAAAVLLISGAVLLIVGANQKSS